jgi:hypothetical protein
VAKELVEEVVEQVADIADAVANVADAVAEETTQVAEATRRLNARNVGLIFTGLGIGAVGGFAVGYFLMRKRLETKYSKLAADEIDDMREHYQRLRIAMQGEVERRRPLEEVLVDRGYTTTLEGPDEIVAVKVDPQPETPEPETRNIFGDVTPDPSWDYAVEVRNRNEDEPYILHVNEFRTNERDWSQTTLTYYEGDDTLSDERDGVIENQDETIGIKNMWRFGHGSEDPSIFFVRNSRLELEIEVIHHPGKYAIEVQGYEEDRNDLKHSDTRRRRMPRDPERD